MSDGKVFQSVGPATEKDLAPYDFKLKRGITRRVLDDECLVQIVLINIGNQLVSNRLLNCFTDEGKI